MLKVIGFIAAFVFGILAHIYVGMVAWNMFMPHYGFDLIDFKQAWIYGMVFAVMSGASRSAVIIKKEAKESVEMLAVLIVVMPFIELFMIHVYHWAAF